MPTGDGECARPLADIGCRDASMEVLIKQAALVALGEVPASLLQGAPHKDVAGGSACNGKHS